MNITDIKIRKIHNEGKMKAVVSVTIDNAFVVHDIKIIDGNNGLFVAMPSRKISDEEYRDIAHPINSSARSSMQDMIFDEYNKAMLDRVQKADFKQKSDDTPAVPFNSEVRELSEGYDPFN